MATLIKTKKIRILYLDDSDGDIYSFEDKVKIYNLLGGEIELILKVTKSFDDAQQFIATNSEKIDVFVCDQNMPQKKGLAFIKTVLIDSYPDILNVLYTGAGNATDNIKKDCTDNKILFSEKTEEFSTLIERMTLRLFKQPVNNMEKLFQKLAIDIIADMQNVEKIDPEFTILISDRSFSPSEIISEINRKTTIGWDYLFSYVDGLKFFSKI